MSLPKKNKRKILVNARIYFWYLRGNEVWQFGKHIAIQDATTCGQLLLLDPYPWQIEIRPQTIRQAIVFGLARGWKPTSAGKSIYIGHDECGFILLPEGQKYTAIVNNN